MQVTRHRATGAFLAAAAPVMARSAEATAGFRAWTAALDANPQEELAHAWLGTAGGGGGHGAALARRDGPLVFEGSDPEAAAAFARALAAEMPRLPGIVGALPACEAFARVWRERTGRRAVRRFHLRHHLLTAVAAVPVATGAPRIAGAADANWLVEAQFAFIVDAGVPDNPERVRAAIPARAARGEFWLWEDPAPVAYAGWSAAGPDAARIGPVYTCPPARRRGYATALVARLAQALLDAGRSRIFLMTDVANPTSNAIYARVGFRAGTDVHHFDFVDAE